MAEDPGVPAVISDRDAELLRAFLAERDVACPGCGYNVRDLTSKRCPECGLELALQLALVEPKQAAFVAGLVGIGAGLGFNGLILGWFLWERYSNSSWGGPPFRDALSLVVGLCVCGWLLWSWNRSRRRLRLMGPAQRWLLAVGCWAITVTFAVIFFAVVG